MEACQLYGSLLWKEATLITVWPQICRRRVIHNGDLFNGELFLAASRYDGDLFISARIPPLETSLALVLIMGASHSDVSLIMGAWHSDMALMCSFWVMNLCFRSYFG